MEQARGFYEQDLQLTKELYAAYPTNVEFKNGLAVSYYQLGGFSLEHQQDPDKACAYFQQAEGLWLELVRDAPQVAKFRQFLGIVQGVLAGL